MVRPKNFPALFALSAALIFVSSSLNAESYTELEASLYVCSSKEKAIGMVPLLSDWDSVREYSENAPRECTKWKYPASFAVVEGTYSAGVVQVKIDRENRVVGDGKAWTSIAQVDYLMNRNIDHLRFSKDRLACSTVDGLVQTQSAADLGRSAGAVVLSSEHKRKYDSGKNYYCKTIHPGSSAIGYRETLTRGAVQVRLFDNEGELLWTPRYWN